jgi:HK97 family phage portal protein
VGILSNLSRFVGRGVSEKKGFGLTDPEVFPIFGSAPSITGLSTGPVVAMRIPAVSCAVGLIAETVGALPIKLFRTEGKAAVQDHPAYRLMHGEANDWTSAEALRISLTTDALLNDKGGFALVIRNATGAPVELHRVSPAHVTVDQAADGEPFYLIATDQGRTRYAYTDVLHVQAFGGVAPITLGRNAIALAAAFEAHIGKVFANGAQPGGIITSPKRLDEEAKKNLKVSWTG